tara:strand:- start:660 stop:914 length:255 start_codon:yes stop_codon:yes gene_type:complete
MNRTKRIENILKKNFINFDFNIEDNSHLHKGHNNFNGEGETHIIVKIRNNNITKVNRLDIHRKVNFLLKEEFQIGLHSLQIMIV